MAERIVDDGSEVDSSPPLVPAPLPNHLLTSMYGVTRAIFRHLPIRSVDSCSLVCQSWAHMSRLIKTRRHTLHALTYPPDPLSPTTTCSGLLHDFDTFVSSYMANNLWSVPCLAFVVATNILASKGFYSSPSSPPPMKHPRLLRSQSSAISRRTERFDISQALIRHLNKSCKVLLVAADGIIASAGEHESNEIESDDAIGILLLPYFPPNTLGIYPFEIPCNAQIADDMSRSELHRFLGSVPDDVSIRCVIFFFVQRQSHAVDCIKKLLQYYSSQVAIIGGFVDKIRYDDRQIHTTTLSCDACGIVITGDPHRLRVGQVVLENHIRTREDIRQKLKQLKSIENQSQLSFAIQVSCVARGCNYYNDETNVECSEFRTLFPNTPLIGVFGNGELGHDHLPQYDEQNQTTMPARRTETGKGLFRGYSTVFSLISLRMNSI